jgi:DnaK suppressor protein
MATPERTRGERPAGTSAAAHAASLPVREGESPWTADELADVRAGLENEVTRLRSEIEEAQADIDELLLDSGDGSGDDQADAGTKTFEREHEISIANNSREMLLQAEHALGRIDDGSYGVCERCGSPIGKERLKAFPRATLCLACKQREERR